MGISVVVPVYNSEATLEALVGRLEPVLRAEQVPFEVVLVNDGSRDGSWDVVRRLSRSRDWVRGVSMMRNYGQHNALLCGVRTARFDRVVTLDDDLQHPPEEIPHLLRKLDEGFGVVYGAPRELPHSLWRNVMSRLTKRAMAYAMGAHNARDLSAFRAFRTDLRRAFANYQSPQVLLDVLLSWGTSRFGAVRVRHDLRKVGKSNYSIARLLNQLMLLLTGFSTAPLRLASIAGFGFTFFGLLVFLYVVVLYFTRGSIPGFPFLASIISLFSGAQLFALGVIGEYLARMFHRSTERPTYVVGATAGGATGGGATGGGATGAVAGDGGDEPSAAPARPGEPAGERADE